TKEIGSLMSVTNTRYLYWLVSNNWYCSVLSASISSRAFGLRRATNRYGLLHPSGWYWNSHCASASVLGDGFHSAWRSSSINREVLRAEITNRASNSSYASTASRQ